MKKINVMSNKKTMMPLMDRGSGNKMQSFIKIHSSIIDNISDAIIILDRNFDIIVWNQASEKIFGLKAIEVVHKNILSNIPDLFDQLTFDQIRAQFHEDRVWEGEIYHYSATGSKILTLTARKIVNNSVGKQEYVLLILHDITSKKLTEKTINEIENRTKAITNSFSGGIVVFDATNKVVFRNSSFDELFKDIFGFASPQCSECPDNNAVYSVQSTHIFCKTMQNFLQSKVPLKEIVEVKSGRFLQFMLSESVFADYKDKGTIIEIDDITNQLENDKKRKQHIANVSHELRNPITGISLAVNNLQCFWDDLPDIKRKKLVRMIEENSLILGQMVDDLLLTSQIEQNKLQLTLDNQNLYILINKTVNQFELAAEKRKVFININVDQSYNVVCDKVRLTQVLRILLDNAIKYSQDGKEILVRSINNFSYHFSNDVKVGTLIEVIDNGIGMKEDDLTHVFECFHRSTDVSSIKGTGLGLSIAKKLVELHGGDIMVKSKYGKGTTFSIFLPQNHAVQ